MFAPRDTRALDPGTDPDGLKVYTISARGGAVDPAPFLPRLRAAKAARPQVDWAATPAFAILHHGAAARYLVLAWWGNGNELMTSVSVEEGDGAWVEDRERYSFCLWDLEVMWHERNAFIRHCYSGRCDLDAYRSDLGRP